MRKRNVKMSKVSDYKSSVGGFTLVEVMVTVLIFSVIIGALNATLLAGDSSWNQNSLQIEVQQELRKAMEWMKDDLRQSGRNAVDVVLIDTDDDWVTFDTSVTFNTVSGVSDGNATWSSDTTQFILSGTDLQRIEGSDTRVLARNIQALQFRRFTSDPDILEIRLIVQKLSHKVNAGEVSLSLDSKVQLRN